MKFALVSLLFVASSLACNQWSCEQIVNLTNYYFQGEAATDFQCISNYESSWCPEAWNGGCCYGLFQINSNHLGSSGCPAQSTNDLYDPDINAQCAVAIYNSQGLNAWQTWTNGDCDGWSTPCTTSAIESI